MNKTIISLFSVSIGVMLVAMPVQASPTNTITQLQPTIEKKVITSREGIRSFQKANGLKVDGIIGTKTKAVLAQKGYIVKLNNVVVNNNVVSKQQTVVNVISHYTSPEDQSPSEYWAEEKRRQQLAQQEQVASQLGLNKKPGNLNRSARLATPIPPANIPHVAHAEQMIGMTAKADRQKLASKFKSSLGQSVDPAKIPWCAAWANMVLSDVGMETTGSLMARSFLAWGVPTYNPKHGDVVVMRRGRNKYAGHVGFFYGFVEHNGVKKIAVLGGNQGKAVKISYYPITRVIAYRAAA